MRVRTPLPSAWLAAPAPAAARESAASRRDAAGSRSAESEFQGTHGIPPREPAAELGFKPLISLSVCLSVPTVLLCLLPPATVSIAGTPKRPSLHQQSTTGSRGPARHPPRSGPHRDPVPAAQGGRKHDRET